MDYEEYLEKYCKCHGISREEAEKHKIVIIYRQYTAGLLDAVKG